jgi:hypothetical protein
MSPSESLSRVGTLTLFRVIGALTAFLLVRLLRLPVVFVLAVLDGVLHRIADQLTALVDQAATPEREPHRPRRGRWGDRWGEAIPSTRRPQPQND